MEQRWGFLAPCCSALKGRIVLRYPRKNAELWDVKLRRLEVKLPRREDHFDDREVSEEFPHLRRAIEESFQVELQSVREALAVLAAVEHVDHDAWKYLLSEHCGVDIGKEGEEEFEEQIPVRFLLAMDLKGRDNQKYKDNLDYDLVTFCGLHQRKHPSPAYLETLSNITALDDKLRTRESGVDIGIPVHAHCIDSEIAALNSAVLLTDIHAAESVLLQQWKQYNQSVTKRDLPVGTFRCTFMLEPPIVDFSKCSLGFDGMVTMARIVRMNMRFSHLSLHLGVDQACYDSCEWKKVLRQLLTRVFDPICRPKETTMVKHYRPQRFSQSNLLQLGALHLTIDPSLRGCDLEASFSAMAVSQTTTKVSINMTRSLVDQGTQRKVWQWLAYGMFSKRARSLSSLTSLGLTSICSMTAEDVAAFSAVLTSDYPEEELLGLPPGRIQSRNATLNPESAVICGSDNDVLSFPIPLQFVRTVSDDGESNMLDVLIPGLGKCQVQRGDLTFDQTQEPRFSTTELTALSLEFHKYQPFLSDGLPRFLECVGQSLKYLTLDGAPVEINLVLCGCPKLDELVLRSAFVELRLNFSEYHCNKKPLPELTSNWEDIESLSTNLADPDNEVSVCLRRLRVFLTTRAIGRQYGTFLYRPHIENDLNSLLHMLEVNQSVEYLDVIVPFGYRSYFPQFRNHHLKPMNRSVKLWAEGKSGFLSVLANRNKMANGNKGCESGCSHQTELNQHVTALIFAFAAPPVLRQVYFREARESSWGVRTESPI